MGHLLKRGKLIIFAHTRISHLKCAEGNSDLPIEYVYLSDPRILVPEGFEKILVLLLVNKSMDIVQKTVPESKADIASDNIVSSPLEVR
jgi:hypothetical protein